MGFQKNGNFSLELKREREPKEREPKEMEPKEREPKEREPKEREKESQMKDGKIEKKEGKVWLQMVLFKRRKAYRFFFPVSKESEGRKRKRKKWSNKGKEHLEAEGQETGYENEGREEEDQVVLDLCRIRKSEKSIVRRVTEGTKESGNKYESEF